MVQPLWKIAWGFLKNKCYHDSAISLLSMQLDKTIIHKDTCAPLFTAVLFTIAKTWKQPKCPSTEGWIKMWYIHNRILLSHKNNEIMSLAATGMDLVTIRVSEVGQTDKDKYHMISHMWNLEKNDTNEFIYKTDSQT